MEVIHAHTELPSRGQLKSETSNKRWVRKGTRGGKYCLPYMITFLHSAAYQGSSKGSIHGPNSPPYQTEPWFNDALLCFCNWDTCLRTLQCNCFCRRITTLYVDLQKADVIGLIYLKVERQCFFQNCCEYLPTIKHKPKISLPLKSEC
jgi:hypothetical protein